MLIAVAEVVEAAPFRSMATVWIVPELKMPPVNVVVAIVLPPPMKIAWVLSFEFDDEEMIVPRL